MAEPMCESRSEGSAPESWRNGMVSFAMPVMREKASRARGVIAAETRMYRHVCAYVAQEGGPVRVPETYEMGTAGTSPLVKKTESHIV